MKFGISTASLFQRMNTEDALAFLDRNGTECAEVFLESFCEYLPRFSDTVVAAKGKVNVHSIHVLTTQFEPQLYSINARAREDSFLLLESVLKVAEGIGAKNYTFHGGARFKKTPMKLDFDAVGKTTGEIVEACARHGVSLCYENVHWGYYNYIGFFAEMKKRVSGLKATLDVKQARQSGISYSEFIDEMGEDINTVHLSDIDENGKMCLPGKGITDFKDLFSRLNDKGFDGAYIIEAYSGDYREEEELFQSLSFVKETANALK